MRVISGIAKGTILFSPKGRSIRPTSDMVREAIFDRLGPLDEECRVLDIFAGSGALGIEALSRGCRNAVFIDKAGEAVSLIERNLEKTRLAGRAKIIKGDAVSVLIRLLSEGESFALIFIDAPYKEDIRTIDKLISIAAEGLLSPHGVLVFEHSSSLEPRITGLSASGRKRYGDTSITYLRRS